MRLLRVLGLAFAVGVGHAGVQALRLLGRGQGWGLAELAPSLGLEAGLAAALGFLVLLPADLLRGRSQGVMGATCIFLLLLGSVAGELVRPPAGPRATGTGVAVGGGARTIVLVTGDTLRRDHVSAYPESRTPGSTPRIDELARDGLLFTDAVTPAPLTLPAHVSLLTGLLPDRHRTVRNGRVIPPWVRGVPTALGEAGYVTGAFVSSSVLHGSHGLSRWFHTYRDELGEAPAAQRLPLLSRFAEPERARRLIKERGDRTVDRALRWTRAQARDQPVFLWVHLYDAHTPHDAHAEIEASDAIAVDPCSYARHPAGFRRGPRHGFPADIPAPHAACSSQLTARAAGLRRTYEIEVRFLDQQVGRLVDGLKALGRGDDLALLFVGDHGESLGEHLRLASHEYSLYDPVVRVPLVVSVPERFRAASPDLDATTSTARVAATLLRLGGLDSPPGIVGPDLLTPSKPSPVLSIGPSPFRRVAGNHPRRGRGPGIQISVRTGSVKVIRDGRGWVERYNLDADPEERTPVWTASERVAAGRMERASQRSMPGPPGLPGLVGPPRPRRPGRPGRPQAARMPREHGVESMAPFEQVEQTARAVLRAWTKSKVEPEPSVGPSPEAVEALRALGYIE
jgi:arylsulfatase A-like enzyme